MPAVRKLPPASEIHQMRQRGMKLKEIASEFDVTEPAVWRALERAGFTSQRMTFRDFLPWHVEPQHKTTAIMERLRSLLKQHNGEECTQTEVRLLSEWLKGLQDHNLVLNYHSQAPANSASKKGGFYYSVRIPADGTSVFRVEKAP